MAKNKSKSLPTPKTGVPVPSQVFTSPVPQRSLMAANVLSPSSAVPPPNPGLIYLQTAAAGSSGIKIYAGYFSEEYLSNELHGTDAADAYDRMRRSDAKVKMCLNAVKTPIIGSNWEIEPATTDNPDHKLHADFIEHVLFKDMDKPFSKTELLSLADFGHCVMEVTHKPVFGHPVFGDYVGVSALGWRSPRSILYWRLNPTNGQIDHIRQLITGDLERFVDIPGEFLLVASIEKEGDLYEGVSLLRAAYGAWKRKNLYLRMMAIGNERNAVPTPILTVPDGKQNTVEYQNATQVLQNYTSHQNSWIAFPKDWAISFVKSDFDPEKLTKSIDFENTEIVSAFMANFLLLGSTQSGSRAVSMDQSEFFLGGIQYIADEAISPINHKLIPQLIKMKFGPQEAYPRMKVTGISDKAGVELSNALKNLCESQVIQPDDELEAHTRKRYQLPKKSDTGVRIVQAPKQMQQGDNVHETDHPGDFEAKPTQLAERRKKKNQKISPAQRLLLGKNTAAKARPRMQFVASGDNTCDECASYDGKVYDKDDPDAPELPIHPNCDCEYEDA